MVSDLMVPTVTFGRYGSAPARRAAPARAPPPLADTAARRTGASSASSGRRSWAPCCRPCDGRSSSRPGARARSRPSKARPRRPAALPPPPRPPRAPPGALALHGKCFHTVQRFVKTKSTKEIIEFYYVWKMSSHYTEWKQNFARARRVFLSASRRETRRPPPAGARRARPGVLGPRARARNSTADTPRVVVRLLAAELAPPSKTDVGRSRAGAAPRGPRRSRAAAAAAPAAAGVTPASSRARP